MDDPDSSPKKISVSRPRTSKSKTPPRLRTQSKTPPRERNPLLQGAVNSPVTAAAGALPIKKKKKKKTRTDPLLQQQQQQQQQRGATKTGSSRAPVAANADSPRSLSNRTLRAIQETFSALNAIDFASAFGGDSNTTSNTRTPGTCTSQVQTSKDQSESKYDFGSSGGGDLPTAAYMDSKESSETQMFLKNPSKQPRKGGGRQWCRILIITVFAIWLIVTMTYVVLHSVQRKQQEQEEGNTIEYTSNGNPTTSATTTTSSSASDRLEKLKFIIVNNQWSLVEQVDDLESPQSKAITYLATNDPRNVPLDDISIELLERYALAVFYYATTGEHWKSDLHWMSTVKNRHVCDWNLAVNSSIGEPVPVGIVECTPGKQVQEIRLPSNQLNGTIPNEIGLLQELKTLNLYNNHLTGTLPEGLRLNSELREVVLHKNELSGHIPTWLCQYLQGGLETLHLAHNALEGTLPKNMHQCQALKVLNLDGNTIEGTLNSLKGLENLELVSLDDNLIDGSLTDDLLTSWTSLEVLDLGQNSIGGSLPSKLLSHLELEFLDLHENFFTGALPMGFRMGAPLKFLALHNNDLQGPLLESIFSLEQLQHLDLSNNDFTGDMPTHIGTLTALEYLYVAFNRGFTPGEIPTEIGKLKQLQDVSFQATHRNGPIPFELQHCKHLKLLDLNENHLTGTIPKELGGLYDLRFLMVQDNEQLEGTIPTSFGMLRHLNTLVLYNTGITGGSASVCDSTNLPDLTDFIAECDKFTTDGGDCPCCTSCCAPDDIPACGSTIWFSQLENPVSNSHFLRNDYQFHEDDLVYPDPDFDPRNSEYYNEFGEMPDGDMASSSSDDGDEEEEMKYTPNLHKATGGNSVTGGR